MRRRSRAPRRVQAATLIAAAFAFGASPAVAQQPPGPDEAGADGSKPKWQLAPVRVNGLFGLIGSWTDYGGTSQRTQLNESLNIGAASYIWQPWFIQVLGNVGLVLTQNWQSLEGGRTPGEGTSRSGSVGLTGGLAANVFPRSRFPFQFSFDVADSRTNGEIISADYRSTRVTLQQNYRTLSGDTNYMGRFDSSTLSSEAYGRDRVNVLGAQMSTAWEAQRLELDASYSDNTRSSDDLSYRRMQVNARHSFRPDDLTNVESLGSISRNEGKLASGASSSRLDFRQVSSIAHWRSDWDEPLIVFGTARLYDASTSGAGSESTSRTASATGSVSYRFSRNLNVSGALSLSYLEGGGESDTLSAQSASVQYQIDPRKWGPATYDANTALAVVNETGGRLGSNQVAQANAAHRLTFLLGSGQASGWSLAFSQEARLKHETETGQSNNFVHSGSLNWRYAPTAGLAGYTSLTVADSRTYGDDAEGSFQLLNFQVSAQLRPSTYSFFTANFTAQWTRQVTALEPERQTTHATSGGLSYHHTRLFGVPRLRYTAQYNAYDTRTAQRLQGNPDAPREPLSWLFEQRLEYAIGKLDARVVNRFAKTDGKKNASVIFSVFRRFGS